LLTEDKKALKKTIQSRNKVRFRLDDDVSSTSDNSKSKSNSDVINSSSSQKYKIPKDDTIYTHRKESIDSTSCLSDYNKTNNLDQQTNYESKFEIISRSLINKKELMNKLIMINSTASTSSSDNENEEIDYELNKTLPPLNKPITTKKPDSADSPNNSNILKVYLENQTVKSFKYDTNTTVKDVLNCLKDKLSLNFIEFFGLCIKLNNEKYLSKFLLLDESKPLYKLDELVNGDQNNNSNTFQCLFRFVFVPSNYQFLMNHDQNSFNYLYEQVIFFNAVFCQIFIDI
jgi:hypothetical protein